MLVSCEFVCQFRLEKKDNESRDFNILKVFSCTKGIIQSGQKSPLAHNWKLFTILHHFHSPFLLDIS